MHIVKIRRDGNRNVVTLPDALGAAGFTVGASVVVEQTATGEVLLVPEGRVRDRIGEIGSRVIAEHREALDLMEAYDRGGAVVVDGEIRRTSPAPSVGS